MLKDNQTALEDAFNSMLRTDYIPLRDTNKLLKLADYYVDYFGYLGQVVGETDQIIVGRRGTGKTTLLYRALIECIKSWATDGKSVAKPRTLAVYLDLSKCQMLANSEGSEFSDFEHVFASELAEAIHEEILRNWPEVDEKPGLYGRVFNSQETKRKNVTRDALLELANIISTGVPRAVDRSGPMKVSDANEQIAEIKTDSKLSFSPKGAALSAGAAASNKTVQKLETEQTVSVTYRLSIADIIRVLGDLRVAANISHIILLVDELSSLSNHLQRRFSTLARKILGNHAGVYMKICGITDNFTLGTSIIIQRDVFQLPLDLDAFVERSGTLNGAMDGLVELSRKLITDRVHVYANLDAAILFEDAPAAWIELSKSAMGVPRTLGIALKQAYYRALNANRSKITKADIEFGIKYASKAYLDQFVGACGVAVADFYDEIWSALLDKAIAERSKTEQPASHFLILPRNEVKLRYLKMFFLVHLLTQGRTTKKDKTTRSLYVFDYGICLENNLRYGTDKNVLRQQRFAYDDDLSKFDVHFDRVRDQQFICPKCGTIYKRSDLIVAGQVLTFCPKDKDDLQSYTQHQDAVDYTEEEMKIVGAIRSANEEDELLARRIADDVGCYVQKVAKFGEKLDRDGIIDRKKKDDVGKNIYFRKDQ